MSSIAVDQIEAAGSEVAASSPQNKSKKAVKVHENYRFWYIWNWFRYEEVESVESKIFECINGEFERRCVDILDNTQKIWTVSTNTDSEKTPLVLVHGFCGAIGLWMHNLDKLCQDRPLYAFDLIGFGRSSRPAFSTDPGKAEDEFIDSIEEWRKALGIKEMILLGHSFGGFLSSSYALKYPTNVKALILADPWGFSERNPDIQYPLWIKIVIKLAAYMGPFSMVRATGSIGLSLFKKLRPDFRYKFVDVLGDTDLIYDYIYHSNKPKPSGEEGFRAIADQIRYAKNPMIKRIENLDANIPLWFIYGAKSWIDMEAGTFVKEMRENSFVSVKLIHKAGHHVYADQPQLFNEHVQEILASIY